MDLMDPFLERLRFRIPVNKEDRTGIKVKAKLNFLL